MRNKTEPSKPDENALDSYLKIIINKQIYLERVMSSEKKIKDEIVILEWALERQGHTPANCKLIEARLKDLYKQREKNKGTELGGVGDYTKQYNSDDEESSRWGG